MATDIGFLKQVIMQRISDTMTTVQDVSNYEKSTFSGYPAVNVLMSDNTNDFWTNAENQRAFTFIVRIYQQITAKTQLETATESEKSLAESIMERVVSQLIDTFDEYYAFGGNADYLRAAPSVWGYAYTGNGWCRTADVKLSVVKSFEVY